MFEVQEYYYAEAVFAYGIVKVMGTTVHMDDISPFDRVRMGKDGDVEGTAVAFHSPVMRNCIGIIGEDLFLTFEEAVDRAREIYKKRVNEYELAFNNVKEQYETLLDNPGYFRNETGNKMIFL